MYQDRSEDLDPRVNKVLNEGPKILETLEFITNILPELYRLKEKKDGFYLEGIKFNHRYQRESEIDPNNLPKNWDYTKEFKESLTNLNESVLDAYITFLECEREALIKRWNKMAKDLK